MKKVVLVMCLLLSSLLFACNYSTDIDSLPIPPVIEDFPENDNLVEDEVEEETEEKKYKKYLVSKTDGLRVRSSPSGSSSVVGSLDKNDVVAYIDSVNEYYKTIYKEKTAYIHKKYCDVLEIEESDEKIEKAIEVGASLLGYPYVWGSQRYHWGNGKLNSNFVSGEYDCSALTLYVYYKSNGVILDVTSRKQTYNGKEVKRADLKRGDLLFFTNAQRKDKKGEERIGHVGIYFGNNYILHTASDHAVIEPISATRWSYYITARRVV